MGKAKKSKSTRTNQEERNAPLADQILGEQSVRSTGRKKHKKQNDQDEEFVDEKLSRRILEQARRQQADLEEEHGIVRPQKSKTVRLSSRGTADLSDEDEEEEEELSDAEESYEHVVVDEEDEAALARFMTSHPPARRTLADIIQDKLTEKKTEIQSHMSEVNSVQMQELDERVVSMYKAIKDILVKYRSGKLPKAFKIIPSLSNWEQHYIPDSIIVLYTCYKQPPLLDDHKCILYITEPDTWSAAATYQATRIFASNLNAKMAQRFFNLVVLPRVRDDISEYKRLNFHLYMALRKSLFKPAAFFKGILLPLCESGTCTLREAIIITSVLAKNSIPMLHSAAAILKIAEMDYNGANSIFLRTLLDKKYALPYRVIDAVVFHFLGFRSDKREMPVLWHQCLLTFVQRYKSDISSEQKDALNELLKIHIHAKITPEIRRELMNSKCRDEESEEHAAAAMQMD